jgi:hypothetical protein
VAELASWSPPVQTIWLRPDAIRFAEVCEACAADASLVEILHERAAIVVGTLRPSADVRFVSCPRGHRLRVRRVARSY